MIDTEDSENRLLLAPQTKITALGYLIILTLMVVTLLSSKDLKMQQMQGFAVNIVVFVIMSAITVYTVNCIVIGKCGTYAWIVSYIILANALTVLLYLIIYLLSSR